MWTHRNLNQTRIWSMQWFHFWKCVENNVLYFSKRNRGHLGKQEPYTKSNETKTFVLSCKDYRGLLYVKITQIQVWFLFFLHTGARIEVIGGHIRILKKMQNRVHKIFPLRKAWVKSILARIVAWWWRLPRSGLTQSKKVIHASL